MFYKIVGVSEGSPDKPVVYTGECVGGSVGDHLLLLALASEFGDGEGCAVRRLGEWSGGEAVVWEDGLLRSERETGKAVVRGEFVVEGTKFYVEVGELSFAEHVLREDVKDRMVLAGLRCLWRGLRDGGVTVVEAGGSADEVKAVFLWFGGDGSELVAM